MSVVKFIVEVLLVEYSAKLHTRHFRTDSDKEIFCVLHKIYSVNGWIQNEQKISGMCTHFRIVIEAQFA